MCKITTHLEFLASIVNLILHQSTLNFGIFSTYYIITLFKNKNLATFLTIEESNNARKNILRQ